MAAICLDEWELLPDQKSSSLMEECGNGHGSVGGTDECRLLLGAKLVVVDMDHFAAASRRAPYGCVFGEDAKNPVPVAAEFKDIGVVEPELKKREEATPKVTEIMISDAEAEEGAAAVIKFPRGVKEVDRDHEVLAEAAAPTAHQFAGEDDEGAKKTGNLRAQGVGALCSFGVAAATFCIFLLGGRPQQNRQNHKIQLQMYAADDQRIQRVMQQASRLNQTMSSVMGGAPSAAGASISFGGYYNGFR